MSASREHRQRLYEQLVGQNIVGRFEITNLLGFGGMGAVYEAVQRNMKRSVAIKIIPSHDPTTTARFKREAVTISQLHHPNTVTVFDYGETDQGMLFLAMEMLTGRTLSDLIEKEAPLEPARAAHIASQVCRALGEAHKSAIVHRDIKPDNIFLIEVDDDPDFVKVLDFGIAKIVRGEDNVELTGTGRIIGTPKYMSPEQILAEPIDHRSDLYSLGCILFEMLCGNPPFQDSSTTKLMLAHAHQTPPTFAERLPNQALARIPGPLEQVVRRALSKSPSERQASTDIFRAELDAALEASDRTIAADAAMGSTQVQTTPSSSSAELTDSSDLLAQHSSQTLAKLNPRIPAEDSPTEPVDRDDEEAAGSSQKSSSRAPIIVIAAVLCIIALLAGYQMVIAPADEAASAEAEMVIEEESTDPAEKAESDGEAEEAAQEAPPKAADEDSKTPETLEVEVTSDPTGASVFADDKQLGKTPMSVEAEVGSTLAYRFALDGHRDLESTHEVSAEDGPGQLFKVLLDKKEVQEKPKRPKRTRKPVAKKKPEPTESPDEETSEPAEEPEEPKDTKPKVDMLDDPVIDRLDD
ncbi:MAG: protein kinase domain-containing protein [Persicimonas sp.]